MISLAIVLCILEDLGFAKKESGISLMGDFPGMIGIQTHPALNH